MERASLGASAPYSTNYRLSAFGLLFCIGIYSEEPFLDSLWRHLSQMPTASSASSSLASAVAKILRRAAPLGQDGEAPGALAPFWTPHRLCQNVNTYRNSQQFNLLATDFFSNFSTPCISNVSNTETKQGSIMK